MITENALVELVNEYLDVDVYLEKYQKIELYIYDQGVLKDILSKCKFKDQGSAYDYPEALPETNESIGMLQIMSGYDLLERIAVSPKYNAVMLYTANVYYIYCVILIDVQKVKKFSKKVKPILTQDAGGVNLFRDVTFDCGKGKYIEITAPRDDKTKMVDIIQHKISKETLVFDPNSVINEVMNDINIFFQDKTFKLYTKLEIPYKRGIILYGDPGNGKSAMIREIIRTIPDVVKIVINSGVKNITAVLHSLVKSLDGKKAMVVIEDMDSVITDENRSEFLNILDGVNIISGIYFIGTTNYPDRIDPAFMNRSGRFDRTFKIDNPTEATRRLFFESRKLGKLFSYYKTYNDDSVKDSDDGVVELFVKNSEGLPMANLKELITSTSYLLASDNDMTVEEAVTSSYNNVMNTREEHVNAYNNAQQNNYQYQQGGYMPMPPIRR